ncbi:MAG: cytidylate kinase-like family protein [Acholeplasmatales bacterium]|nr:cytidylate kinase-like family protein [Acholeplasmatales bacterium]
MKYVITIGREYGSGGRFIGKLLAEKLGIAFYDSELLIKAAEESGLSENIFKNYDEKKDGVFGAGLGIYSYDMTLGQKVFLAQFDTIKKIAEKESCIIVGRCADYVLKDYPNLISIFITAPIKEKVERAIEYYGVNPNKAQSIIQKTDKKRRSYYNFYTDKDWGKASNYDLCINSKIGVDECVDAIEGYVKARLKLD